jgi:exopolysaccharide production protein ExoZ
MGMDIMNESKNLTQLKSINVIQLLRAIAALLVVVLHSYNYLFVRGIVTENEYYGIGRSGVDVFFVISGFIIYLVTNKQYQKGEIFNSFLLKRIIRIAPTYWFYSFLIGFILFFFPSLFSDNKSFDNWHFFMSFMFIPWESAIGQIKPILPVGWTLNYELYFYLVVTTLLVLQRKYFFIGLVLWMFSSVIVGCFLDFHLPILNLLTSPLLLEFVMGMVVGYIYFNYDTIKGDIWIFIIATVVFVNTIFWDTSTAYRVLKWGVPASLIILSLVFIEKNNKLKLPPLFIKLGSSSYSLYLTHIFSINAFGFVWSNYISKSYDYFLPIVVILSLFIGHVAFLIFERPLTNLLNNLVERRMNKKYVLNKYEVTITTK